MTIIYAYEDVLNKVALNNLVIFPYEVMFYKSLFQLPLFIVTVIVVCLLDKYYPSINTISLSDYIIKNKSKLFGRIIYRFSFIISNIFRTLSLMKVIQILSPNHLSILKSLEFVVLSSFSMAKNFINNEYKNNIIFYIIELICCFILLFASFIHNEIIIINRCNLSKETDYYKYLTFSDRENIEEPYEYIQRITKHINNSNYNESKNDKENDNENDNENNNENENNDENKDENDKNKNSEDSQD